ncbi:unknown [Clostridium sp. CAG:306]|nr:unknown [Clostridium sp. CAG:306]
MLPEFVVLKSMFLPALIVSVFISTSIPFKTIEPFSAEAFTESAAKIRALFSRPISVLFAVKSSLPLAVIVFSSPS